MNQLALFLKLLRPHQWIKSGFVFVGLLFGHAWGDSHLVHKVLLAAAAFALAASTIYVINDLADRQRDREHPEKRYRPLASGAIGLPEALMLAGCCLCAALVLASFALTACSNQKQADEATADAAGAAVEAQAAADAAAVTGDGAAADAAQAAADTAAMAADSAAVAADATADAAGTAGAGAAADAAQEAAKAADQAADSAEAAAKSAEKQQ